MSFSPKIYTSIIQLSIFGLTLSLVWFAFVYYPKVIDNYKNGRVPQKSVFNPVSATDTTFPIETTAYRITYEDSSQSYYAFIAGESLDEYAFNRDNAKLALKTALSVASLCSQNVFYVAASGIEVPEHLRGNSDC